MKSIVAAFFIYCLSMLWGIPASYGQQFNGIPSTNISKTLNELIVIGGVQNYTFYSSDGQINDIEFSLGGYMEPSKIQFLEVPARSIWDINCASRGLEKATFNLKVDLGEEYNLGKRPFEYQLGITVSAMDAGGNSIPNTNIASKTMTITNEHPEQLFQFDITTTNAHPDIDHYKLTVRHIAQNFNGDAKLKAAIKSQLRVVGYTHNQYTVDANGNAVGQMNQNYDPQKKQMQFSWSSGCSRYP
ncbi:MAG: hypothetical protein MK212_22280, partial [Saprospiraceae bacterium]|nr:hypothetical protein [Saprospiraceae bacterium]